MIALYKDVRSFNANEELAFGHCNGVACPFRRQRPGGGHSQLVSLWATHERGKKMDFYQAYL